MIPVLAWVCLAASCGDDAVQPPPGPETKPPAVAAAEIVAVDADRHFVCALDDRGRAYCWGRNLNAELGLGDNVSRPAPTAVVGISSVTAVHTGEYHGCVLSPAGEAYCWGNSSFGQTGLGRGSTAWSPEPVFGGHRFASMALGFFNTCGLTADGELYCWGAMEDGQLGPGLESDCYAPECRFTPTRVHEGWVFTQVAVAYGAICGLTPAGRAYCWGSEAAKILGSETGSTMPVAVPGGHTFAAIRAGSFAFCGMEAGGRTHCWGSGLSGSFGDGEPSGPTRSTPVLAAGGMTFADLRMAGWGSSAGRHACGLRSDGTLYCWGGNDEGQLGTTAAGETCGTTTPIPCSSTPVRVDTDLRFRAVSVAWGLTCAISQSGDLWCWGSNSQGRLGIGSTDEAAGGPTPVRVRFPWVE